MKLANKNFIYSILVACVVTLALSLMIYFLMPGLYVHYRGVENQQNAKNIFNTLKQKGTLYQTESTNGLKVFSLRIPDQGYDLFFSSNFGETNVSIINPSLKELVDVFRQVTPQEWETISNESLEEEYSSGSNQILKKMGKLLDSALKSNAFLELDFLNSTSISNYSIGQYQMLSSSKESGLFQSSVIENKTQDEYISYFGYINQDGNTTLFLASTITPSIKDVQPVLLNLVLMMLPTVLLISLIGSRWYSKSIIEPIANLSKDAIQRRNTKGKHAFVEIKGKDEIAELGQSLNLLYQAQNEQVSALESRNHQRDLMLKAFSHQLKTPLVASRLLVDSMIHKVGKYSEIEKYLPEVKLQLDVMQQMVSQLLSINQLVTKSDNESVVVLPIVNRIVQQYQILANDKNIKFSVDEQTNHTVFNIDSENLIQILTNLIGNAVEYTHPNGQVNITIQTSSIIVFNSKAHIDEYLFPQLFEPFISSKHEGKGHGLGLYVAQSCALANGYEISAKNINNGVSIILQKKRS